MRVTTASAALAASPAPTPWRRAASSSTTATARAVDPGNGARSAAVALHRTCKRYAVDGVVLRTRTRRPLPDLNVVPRRAQQHP